MPRDLPTLNSLRAFEAAARHLSFKKAAAELHVTPAAISQQVRTLEEYRGVVLFERLTRALRLTEAGEAALPLLREGFDRLAEACEAMGAVGRGRIITVSVAPSFGAKWLVPRLERFRHAHPDYDIRVDAKDEHANFAGDGVDIALRYGRGDYPKLRSDCLIADVAFPVCSPQLLSAGPPLRRPEDLRHYPLLHVQWKTEEEAAPNWRMWLRAAGVDPDVAERGPRFSSGSMAVDAALRGQGVVLASGALVDDDLQSGRLVRPFPDAIEQETAFCYYLVYPEAKAGDPKVAAFRDWVLGEVAANRRDAG
ncbi:MAG: transcriptional regulator GcvA [Alphaproteobacteria bacterium]|nr:transcriptional regulator GcvA [Alphaproteobacteria bacterium]MCB9930082.1 transcriptional regulator GcvA [Alphaproteobacteria bacterium]